MKTKPLRMEKIFLFCVDGLICGVTEDGSPAYSQTMFGFKKDPWEMKEKNLKDMFTKAANELKEKYTVVFATTEDVKKDLEIVLQKTLEDQKIRFSNNDWEYWQKYLLYVRNQDFDLHNANIVSKLDL
jgi:hypothetical protein